jgi:hypothetical protein
MDAERRRADWPHWPDRANGLARRNRLERRLFHDSEREAAIERTHAAIKQLELATAAKAAQIARLEGAVAESNGAAEPEPEREPEPAATYLVFVWTPDGYSLRAAEGAAPEAGTRLSIAGAEHVVAKLGPSPFPSDPRRCAYLDPA